MKNETVQDTVGFRLSTEELFYILEVLELKTLPSLGPNPWGNVSAEQKQQMMASGFNGLRARNLIEITSDPKHPIEMESLFASPFIICATAQKMLSITQQNQDQVAKQLFLYQTPDVIVSHQITEPGVHEFIMTSAREQLIESMPESLGLAQISLESPSASFVLPAEFVKNLLDAITNHDITLIKNTLQKIDAARPYSQSLVTCLENLRQSLVLLFADFPEKMTSANQITGKAITIINSDALAWKIENQDGNSLTFSQLGASGVKQLIKTWVDSMANPSS